MKKVSLLVFCLFLLLVLASFAEALDSPLPDSPLPKRVFELAKDFGTAEWKEENGESPYFEGSMDGINYICIFTACHEKNCSNIILRSNFSGFNKDLTFINTFNRDTRVGKVYLDNNDMIVFDYFINVDKGITRESIISCLQWFRRGLTDLVAQLSEKDGLIQNTARKVKEKLREKSVSF
ncbi:MAG: YbjN domain-containing protein [Desulfovibrio sp.]|nr:YbjN domain-containing protein [Desulfovibrio sp.]